MATSAGLAAAQGIESGFQMGLRADALGEEKRARLFQEDRLRLADQRAEADAELRRKRDLRDERRLSRIERERAQAGAQGALEKRQAELIERGRAVRTAGGPLPEDIRNEFGANAETLGRMRQEALDYWSRVQTGQMDLDSSEPTEVYKNFVAATGVLPEELPKLQQHLNDFQAGMETGNEGLRLRGINGMFTQQLKKGLGGPSPYGGTIARKEIIGLDPARDANGVDHPDKVIPRLRVYVKMEDGSTKYYDAPVTDKRGTGADEKVVAIPIGNAMDYMGELGNLVAASQHPAVAAKLQEGAREGRPAAEKYLAELEAASKPKPKKIKTEQIKQGNKVTLRMTDEETGAVTEKVYEVGATPRVFNPNAGRGSAAVLGMKAALAQLDEDFASAIKDAETDEEIQALQEQYNVDRRAIITKIKPAATRPPSSAEINSAVADAVQMKAASIGLQYDKQMKQWVNTDGSGPATPAQAKQIADAEASAAAAVRDAAAEGKRVTGAKLKEAAGATAKPAAGSDKVIGTVYTNAKGERAKYGGVDAQGKTIWLAP